MWAALVVPVIDTNIYPNIKNKEIKTAKKNLKEHKWMFYFLKGEHANKV